MQLTERSTWVEEPPAWPPRWTATVVGGSLAVIYFIDRGSGTAPVQHLYYLPIILAGTRFLTSGGVVVAFMAVVLYHLANPRLLSGAYAEADLVQIVLFFAVGVVTARLARDKRRLQTLATTDDLTGLRNLRAFEAGLATLVSTAVRTGGHVSLLVLDVDNLKALQPVVGRRVELQVRRHLARAACGDRESEKRAPHAARSTRARLSRAGRPGPSYTRAE